MMSDSYKQRRAARRIELLRTRAPRVHPSGWRRVPQIAGRLLIAISVVLSLIAITRAVQLASCINNNLGTRSAPNNADSAAQIKWIDAIDAWLTASPDMQPAKGQLLVTQTEKYRTVLHDDAGTKAAHPLGHC